MKKYDFNIARDGFYGCYYPNQRSTDRAMILMIGDSPDDTLAKAAVRWTHKHGLSALAMSPAQKDYGHHNYPLERIGRAVTYLKRLGFRKIGICGASTTGMLSLIAASYYEDITLTIALTPCDFVMEGFYRDGKDGAEERPGDNESAVSWQGRPLPYLPYAYRHSQYWQKIQEESKRRGDMIASRDLFDESERLHPLQEEELIKVERIHGRIVFVGAQDDVLWDTCRYIDRMTQRLDRLPHDSTYTALKYDHATHFVFPQDMLDGIIPFGSSALIGLCFTDGRKHPRECLAARRDIAEQLSKEFEAWK
ncbi:MAG: acyl-CoA thioester hydrolase [Solobacterium sp.]|nr:acyl-CoA thioester hydrolase [Solobacterium sp.]